MKIIIVGGVAGGASAAARARRLDEKADITIYERGDYISFANCGLPYHIGEVIEDRDELILMTPESFKDKTDVDVYIRHEVTSVNPKTKTVTVKDKKNNREFEEAYDKLILSPGSSPVRPPIPGADDPDVMALWTINDMDRIMRKIDSGIKNAVVVGGGFIGVEIAENLKHRGIKTSLVEMLPHLMPQLDYEMAQPLHDEMRFRGIKLFLDNGVERIEPEKSDNSTENKKTFKINLKSGESLETDLVIMAVGVKPNTELAEKAGLEIGESRAIKVDKFLRTSNPDIYAVGDAVEVKNLVTGKASRIPLAGPANKQGRMAANNVFGAEEQYKGSLGTSICKIFSLTAAATGINEKTAQNLNLNYKKLYIHPESHVSYYPGGQQMSIKAIFNDDGHILGAQITGQGGVDKRIDILATAIRNKMTLSDLEELELAYAPPYGAAKDPVNFLGFVGNNILEGFTEIVYAEDIPGDYTVVDVRTPEEFECGAVENSINIPIDELRERINEIPKDKAIALMCRTGTRSYSAERILKAAGFKAKNICGGYIAWLMCHSEKGSILLEDSCWHQNNNENNETEKNNPISELPTDFDIELNVCGLQCPGPIVAVKKKIDEMNEKQILKVKASDKGFRRDLPAWCNSTGNKLLAINDENGEINAMVQKSNIKAEKSDANNSVANKKTTLVLFSNDLDKSMAAFILATGFASLGHEVSVFFTFWGLNVLRKNPGPKVKKDFLSRMFGMMMPKGAQKLALSKMHMMGAGTAMMKHVMNSKNVDSLPDLIKQAQEMGVNFIACEMAMNVMGIQAEELLDGVDTGGVANFAEISEKSGTTLFI